MNAEFICSRGGTLLRGKVSSPHLNPHVCLHFYVTIKGLRRVWLFEVSESPSRGYWKQFLLSRPYEHSQNLHAADGDTLPRGKVCPLDPHVCFHFYVISSLWTQNLYAAEGALYSGVKCPPPPQPSCMLAFLCNDKGIEKSLVIWSFWKPFKRILETISPISSLWTQSEFTCSRGGHSTPG